MKRVFALIASLLKRRIVLYGVAPLAVVAALAFSVKPVFFWFLTREFYYSAPAYNYTKPASLTEARRQDLDYLKKLATLDGSFTPASRAEFLAGIAALEPKAGDLDTPQFAMDVSRLVALADNGHTNVRPPDKAALMDRVPLRFGWFAEGLFVVRTNPEHAALLGTRVARMDGVATEELLARLKPYYGGNFEHLKSDSPYMLESPDALHATDASLPRDRLVLDLVSADGRASHVEVPALPPDADTPDIWPERELAPAPVTHDAASLTVLRDDDRQPWVLRNADGSLFWRTLAGGRGLYVHLWSIDDDQSGPLAEQLQKILDGLKPASLDYAVVDLRLDGGGNYLKAFSFAKHIPGYLKNDGKLYVLTDNHTFSAAIVTLAWLRHYGGSRTVIIGEHAGDREEFWAEGSHFVLPNSKLWMAFRTGHHDWEHGCYNWSRCFWPNVFYSVPAGKLGPDVTLAWKFSDYAAGRDTLLDYVQQAEAHGPSTSTPAASAGQYRLPFVDGTGVKVFDDFHTHRPPGRVDLFAVDGDGPYGVVAAAAGRIMAIQDGYREQQSGRAAKDCHNNYVWIAHLNGEWTNYSHIAYHTVTGKAGLKVGAEVQAGQYLGDEGDVGCAMLKHVHFEVAVPDPRQPIDTGGFLTDNVDGKRELNPRFCGVPGGYAVKGETYRAEACGAGL